MAAGFEMRVGDAEREAAAAELREHYASGRLTLDELNERLDKAFAARTRADLNVLMTDLPSARPGWSAAGARPGAPAGIGSSGAGGSGTPQGGPARAAGAVLATLVVMGALLFVGTLGVFGIGTGRPFGIVLILAALALLRRLFFGRRRTQAGRMRGCRRW
jgi:hypothetical protein